MSHRLSFVLVATAAIGLLLIVIIPSPHVRGGPPPPVTILAAASVRGSDRAITLTTRAVGGAQLIETRRPRGATALPPLAASPDGQSLVIRNVDPGQPGPLIFARADGSQVEVALPGVRGAAFDLSGAWAAVVDLAGAMWRVDAHIGAAVRLAEGPYGSDPAVLADGRVLAVRLSSVDAPAWSSVVIVDPQSGVETPVAPSGGPSDLLVYQAFPLVDGSVALARHRIGGGVSVIHLRPDEAENTVLELEGAPRVALSPDGAWVAWVVAGRAWVTSTQPDAAATALGAATGTRFSPDGRLLLVYSDDRAMVVDHTGNRVADADPSACWAGDGGGCRP